MSYQALLEDLAAKRRALGDLIVALARVAGVDPAPYLVGPGDVTQAASEEDRQAVPRARPTKGAETRPAGNQVLDAKVLSVLKNGPLGPKAIAALVQASKYVLAPVFERLIESKAIKKSGAGRSLVYQIP